MGIIICSDSNKNAEVATYELKKQGISNTFILKGGIDSWLNAGFPLVKKKINYIPKK